MNNLLYQTIKLYCFTICSYLIPMTRFIPPQKSNSYHSKLIHLILLWSVIVIGTIFAYTNSYEIAQQIIETKNTIVNEGTKLVAKNIGTSMKKDDQWNINILLAGYGGDFHDWWYLTDSMMLVSYNPNHHSISMISLPRDLFVNNNGRLQKLNAVLASNYASSKDLNQATLALNTKLNEITGLEVYYYGLVDFEWFANFIDTLWWLEIDIPKAIYDTRYPWPNRSYRTFSIKSWPQHIDGPTALKYARSRYSTSDFDRSERQQLIIKSTIEKFQEWWLSIEKIKSLHSTYQQYITTNISVDEMIGLLRYDTRVPHLHSFNFTTECANTIRQRMQPWCLLYNVIQADFNNMAGMLPFGASRNKLSHYPYTRGFSRFVTYHGGLFNEERTLRIYNAIDPNYAKSYRYRSWLASNLALLLKRHGIPVEKVDNSTDYHTNTKAIIYGSGDHTQTIATLQTLFPIEEIEIYPWTIDINGNEFPNHVDIYLWNSFIDLFGSQPFSTYLSYAQ